MLYQAFAVVVFSVRALLAATLVVAGIAKLTDREGFTRTLIELGVSARKGGLSRTLAILVPLIELSLGLLVVSGLWPILANTAMLFLMLLFSGMIIFALRKAPNALCQCFGALSSTRFSRNLLLRNIALTVLALFVLSSSLVLPFEGVSLWLILVLIAEYLVLAVVAAHAVRVVEEIKERMAV